MKLFEEIKLGVSQWYKETPKVVYKIGNTMYAMAIALGGYTFVAGQDWAIKLGAGLLLGGILLERISGIKLNKYENETKVDNSTASTVQQPNDISVPEQQ